MPTNKNWRSVCGQLVVIYSYKVIIRKNAKLHIIFCIYISIEKRWYIAILKLSQYFSDNHGTEFWKKCDIMKIIKSTDVKKTHDCESSVGRTLSPSSLIRLGKTLVISLHT